MEVERDELVENGSVEVVEVLDFEAGPSSLLFRLVCKGVDVTIRGGTGGGGSGGKELDSLDLFEPSIMKGVSEDLFFILQELGTTGVGWWL